MLSPGLTLGWIYASATLAALLCAGARWRRGVAVLVMVATVPLAFRVPAEHVTFRAVLALGSLWFTLRVVELARERKPMPAPSRIWHAVGIVDTRRVRRVSLRLEMGALTRLVLATPWAVGAWAGAHLGSEHLEGAARLGVRWVCGAGLMYTGVEAALALTRVLYGLVGIDLRPLHDDPIRSRTISEFWNRRWNRIVHGFLKQNVFEPVARRGHAAWGRVLVFLLSGFLHFYIMWPGVGLYWAGVMGLFFLVQVPLLWAERALKVARWSSLWGRVWTLGWLSASSPLFVEPMMRIVDTWG